MELTYHGANCVRIVTKQVHIIVDDNLKALGLPTISKPGDILLYTGTNLKQESKEPKLVIDQPGEFEVSSVSIQGIATRAHIDEADSQNATIFKLIINDIRVAVMGHIHPDLNDNQLEAIGTIDVLIIPVGGNGYTLDAIGALKIIKKVEPKIIIPTHFADGKVKYEVPQAELDDALKNMSIEAKETVDKLKLKSSELPEAMELIVLSRQ